MTPLHYSPTALVRRDMLMLLAAIAVVGSYVAHAGGGFPHVLGLGFVPSAVLVAVGLYLVAVTGALNLGLMRHGGVALDATNEGVAIRTAWFSNQIAWSGISRIALDVEYDKSSHHAVVAIHETSGLLRRHVVDTRLLSEPLDRINGWIDAAEAKRVALGGQPFAMPTSGLGGYTARMKASTLADDIAAARRQQQA